MSTNGYYYDRTNSKGEVKFRRDTNESLEEVTKYLDDIGIEYQVRSGASMLWITTHRKYAYYYTTGRWAPLAPKGYPKKHYKSNGIADFIKRFSKEKKEDE